MARSLRISRSRSAPPSRRRGKEMERRPRSTSSVDMKPPEDTPYQLLQIIKDVGAREHQTSHREQETPMPNQDVPSEILQIIKEIGARASETKKEAADSETNDTRPKIQQIIKRQRANSTPERKPLLSKRSSLGFLRRSKSMAIPKDLSTIPEVIVMKPDPENKPETSTKTKTKTRTKNETRTKRSASAPTPPASDLLFKVDAEDPLRDSTPVAALQPSRPALNNAIPRARSTSLGQYSLFPKASPTHSPRTSPKVQARTLAPPLPPLPNLEKEEEKEEKVDKPSIPSIQINSQEIRKPPQVKLAIQIPPKAERPAPELENPEIMPETESWPSSAYFSSPPRSSKRVTFSESRDEIIDTTSRKSSSPACRSLPPRQASWSSVFLLATPETFTKPPLLSRTASMSAMQKPTEVKSILRRTSSYSEMPEEEKSPEQKIVENPMMVRNLKRLPRKNTGKKQPLPKPSTPPETPNPRPDSVKYIRHPIIIPDSLHSPPSSTSSSYASSDSARSSFATTTSSVTENDVVFKTISEPLRFSCSSEKSSRTPSPGMEPILMSNQNIRSEIVSPTGGPAYWSSGDREKTRDSGVGLAPSERRSADGKWSRQRSHHSVDLADAPPVPSVPRSVGVM
ncbi:hypothetical protein P280DRAFT_214447 [Massarina eburnea CBS 473.64]|uniref:Uncharacterized protein n=1 Tax=Massarina eburnea CBS 473.64 TaxID=1395130 RepID=A0A6A6S8W3_9PLEO|nr:hypothetical protein P280DRAFT_214447 [Massarina eburnea CBS 473.64]